MADLDDRIDALYQLAPEEFTSARTELARTLKADEARRVKALKKPTAVPWAVNRLYWQDRRAFARLLDLGQSLRKAQVAALEGRKADVRQAAAAHRESVSAAASRAVELARAAGVHVKAEAIARMLEAVSLAKTRSDHPGRFTEVLHPAAFEALEGVAPRPAEAARKSAPDPGRHEQSVREERQRLERAVAKAEHALGEARMDEADTRKAHARAEAAAQRAEEVFKSARAALEKFAEDQPGNA